LVGTIGLLLLLAGSMPLHVEAPDTVTAGQSFSVTVRCVSSSCTGLSAPSPATGSGIAFIGSSTSSSISIVNTPQGTTRQSQFTLVLNFLGTKPGNWSLGPIEIHGAGTGTHVIPHRMITVLDSGSAPAVSTVRQPPVSRRYSWIVAEPRADARGRTYPGVPVIIDYYLYTRYNASNITYYWSGSRLGVISDMEEVPQIQWEPGDHSGVRKARFFTLTFVPAGAGFVPVPVVSAQITYSDVLPFTAPKDYLVSDSLSIDVYPYPEPIHPEWDGAVLDSVHLELERTGFATGQAGEQTVRLWASGPGAGYIGEPGFVTVHGDARLMEGATGVWNERRWWDFLVEPADTGIVVIGPDSVVWLDRKNARYRFAVVSPCTLRVDVIPRRNREIELTFRRHGPISTRAWVILSLGALGLMCLALMIHGRRTRNRDGSVATAKDIEELLNRFEGEASVLLTGSRRYLGYEELQDCLEKADTFLARRILRFWKDMEQHLSGREPGREEFEALRETAVQLIRELAEDESRKKPG